MNAALLDPTTWPRVAALMLIVLPALFILGSRRAAWWSKLLWIVASQLSWAFVGLYDWVLRQRYPDTPVADGGIGWWTYAFPWAVYLLYRATRSWFPGERRGGDAPGPQQK